MKIECQLSETAYRYGKKWLFRYLSFQIENGGIHLITGSNGSGKSTLLRLLTSALEPEEGSISYKLNGKVLDADQIQNEISYVAPGQELPEEFSLAELIALQEKFLPVRNNLYEELMSRFGLQENSHKPIRDYSTGMKQKAKFVLSLGMDRPVWLLDEPGLSLDVHSCSVLHELLRDRMNHRLIILASNDPAEISLGEIRASLG